MSALCAKILEEMTVFADLGTKGAEVVRRTGDGFVIRLFRNGEELALALPKAAPVAYARRVAGRTSGGRRGWP